MKPQRIVFEEPDTKMSWTLKIGEIEKCLQRLSALRRGSEGNLNLDDAFDLWAEMTIRIREQKGTVFLIGNGASASMSSHVAADLAKNGYVHTEVFSDLSLITAIANDMGYEEVFSEPLRRRMNSGDMLVAISSSGESVNVLRAVEESQMLKGVVVTLSAMNRENTLSTKGDLNFHVPAATYGLAETCHAAILHHWIDKIVERKSR